MESYKVDGICTVEAVRGQSEKNGELIDFLLMSSFFVFVIFMALFIIDFCEEMSKSDHHFPTFLFLLEMVSVFCYCFFCSSVIG